MYHQVEVELADTVDSARIAMRWAPVRHSRRVTVHLLSIVWNRELPFLAPFRAENGIEEVQTTV